MYDSGFVLEVTKYLTRDRINLDKDWAVLGIERWRQKTYGVPYWGEPHAVFYNKTLFQQKGVPDPWVRPRNKGTGPWTRWWTRPERINDPANDVYGMQWGMGDYNGIGPLVWTQGVSHLQYDPKMEFDLQLRSWSRRTPGHRLADATAASTWPASTPAVTARAERLQGGKPAIDRPTA